LWRKLSRLGYELETFKLFVFSFKINVFAEIYFGFLTLRQLADISFFAICFMDISKKSLPELHDGMLLLS